MIARFLNAFFLLLVIAIGGCTTASKEKEIETKYVTQIETNTIALEPPRQYYNSSVVRIRPPDSNKYLNSTWEQKEKMLMEMINKQSIQVEACMRDRYSINEWVKEQQAQIDKKNTQSQTQKNTKAKK